MKWENKPHKKQNEHNDDISRNYDEAPEPDKGPPENDHDVKHF